MMSVIFIFLTSLFGKKKLSEKNYFSIGYIVLFTQIVLNSIVLGTWSFAIGSEIAPSLPERLLQTFDITRRSAVWEMTGQLIITSALAQIAIVLTNDKKTITRSFTHIQMKLPEKLAVSGGLLLMFIGAIIESLAITRL